MPTFYNLDTTLTDSQVNNFASELIEALSKSGVSFFPKRDGEKLSLICQDYTSIQMPTVSRITVAGMESLNEQLESPVQFPLSLPPISIQMYNIKIFDYPYGVDRYGVKINLPNYESVNPVLKRHVFVWKKKWFRNKFEKIIL